MTQTMTPRENFRLGFLLRCAEEGLDRDAIVERVKFASVMSNFVKMAGIGDLVNGGKFLAFSPLHAWLLGMGGSTLAGAGLGYGAAKMQDQSVDPEEAKRQELMAAYRAQADRIRRKTKQMDYRRPAPQAPQLFNGDDNGL